MDHPYRYQSYKFLKGVTKWLPPLPRWSGSEMLFEVSNFTKGHIRSYLIMIKFQALVLNIVGWRKAFSRSFHIGIQIWFVIILMSCTLKKISLTIFFIQ
jgi:hypothetical protein